MEFKMTPSKSTVAVDIKTELIDRCPDVLVMLGINPMAMSTKIVCPISPHETPWPTFSVNPLTNRYYCSVCEKRGGSLEDLVIKTGRAATYKGACTFLRAGLGLLKNVRPLEQMFENPDPIDALGSEPALDEDGVDDDELRHPDSCEQEAELEEILRDCTTGGWSPYAAKLKIAPHGAMLSPRGSLVVAVRKPSGYIHGVLEIEANGQRTIHNGVNLDGAATVLGDRYQADIMFFVRDWESQVVMFNLSGGRCIVAYHEPKNLLASAYDFVTDRVKTIWLYKSNKDDAHEIAGLKEWAQTQTINLQVIDTGHESLIDAYRRAMGRK
jgi:hypothetical protein